MRKWFASLAALGLVNAAATAQTIPSLDCWPLFGYDNGVGGTGWKVIYPTGAGDRFNVDFNADLAGLNVVGLALDMVSTNPGGSIGQVAYCTSNFGVDSTGTTPDTVGGVISGSSAWGTSGVPASSAAFCGAYVGLDFADFTAGSDVHAVMTMVTGDTTLWLCSDTSAAQGRSYFTTNNYATTAIPFTVNWMMRAVYGGTPGSFTINGATAVNVRDDGTLALQFWGTAGTTGYLQGLFLGGTTFIALPGFVVPTGQCNFVPPGTGPDNGVLSGSLAGSCPPVGLSLSFGAFWLDNTNLKANGHATITLTNLASFTVTSTSKACCPLPCYGINDDGVLDSIIWKVAYPSTSGDWFNVKCGPVPTGVTNLLSMEAPCWDFNGTGGTFKDAGAYKANLGLDPTGNTMDPASPISAVGGASASVAPGASQWGYPATLFDFADVAATLGSIVHIGLHFNTGDTGLWQASDTDAADINPTIPSGCGVLPNTTSFFTSNNFTTSAIPFSTVNAMQILHWN